MTYFAALLVIAPLVALYALAIRWADRLEPEPWWILALCFLWGATGAALGGGLSTALAEGLTSALFLDGASSAALSAYSATVYAPLFEEAFKGLGILVLFVLGHLVWREFDGPLDGVVYGGMIGLGFTLTEDILYVGTAGATGGAGDFFVLTVLRTVFGGLAHALYTSMTGFGWGMAARAHSWPARVFWPCFGFSMAVLLHAIHNFLPSYFGAVGGLLTIVLTWGFFLAWFGLIAGLVLAERRTVRRQLSNEVGGLVRDQHELLHVTTLFERSLAHLGLLFAGGFAAWRLTRRRHRALVELALVKDRRARGDHTDHTARLEASLRHEIATLASQGARS
jgi:RsiW-degrading membrane proteinase PrsW (M82 family)